MGITPKLQSNGLYRLSIDNAGRQMREDAREYVSSFNPAHIRYDASDIRGEANPKTLTQRELFKLDREREARLVSRFASLGYRSLVVFIKRDAAHKRIAAFIVFDARGIAWFDVLGDKVSPRGTLEGRSVSEEQMRNMLGVEDEGLRVYAQDCKAFIKSYNQRMRHNDRRYHSGISSGSPKVRRSGDFNLKCKHMPDPVREVRYLDYEEHPKRPERFAADEYLLARMKEAQSN